MSAVSSVTAPDGSRFSRDRAPHVDRPTIGIPIVLPADPGASDPAALAVPTARLRITDAAGVVTAVTVSAPLALIGRAQDVQVKLESGMVSRHHAEMARDPAGRWVVRDMHSRNGTMVNGVAIASRPLEPGDRIGIGPYTLTFVSAAIDIPTRPRLPVSDNDAGPITTIHDVPPPQLAATHLTTLCDFGRELLATADRTDRLRALCRLLVGRNFHGRWAYALHLAAADPGSAPVPLCEPQCAEAGAETGAGPGPEIAANGGATDASAYISRGVLRAVRHKGEAVLAGNTGGDDVEVSVPFSVLPVAAVAVPLRQDPAGLDVLYVTLEPDCGNGEWLALTTLAAKQLQHADDAWSARREAEAHAAARAAVEAELERAHQIQMRLVPRTLRVPGLDLALGFLPCRWVAGDYVDVAEMKDGRTLLVVADVCGKGLPAALIASSVHSMVHAGLEAGMGLAALMSSLNGYLARTLADEFSIAKVYVTMVAIALDPATGAFECINAGHPPALLLTPGGGHRKLQSAANWPLACADDDPVIQTGQIEKGQLLFLYTDGLTEVSDPEGQDGEQLGIDGLCRRLGSIYTTPPPVARYAADALTHQLNILLGHRLPDDDRTFLLARLG